MIDAFIMDVSSSTVMTSVTIQPLTNIALVSFFVQDRIPAL
jgi:hypothetical protein